MAMTGTQPCKLAAARQICPFVLAFGAYGVAGRGVEKNLSLFSPSAFCTSGLSEMTKNLESVCAEMRWS